MRRRIRGVRRSFAVCGNGSVVYGCSFVVCGNELVVVLGARADLRHLADYVQSVAEAHATPAEAIAVIESAFMRVRKPVARTKAELEARNDEMPGTVEVIAKAVAPRATYFWQYSLDQVTWVNAAETMRASTAIGGRKAAQTYFFRFRSLTPGGPRDYSQVVSLLVR